MFFNKLNYFLSCTATTILFIKKATKEKTPAKIKLVPGFNLFPWDSGIIKNKTPATNNKIAPSIFLNLPSGNNGNTEPATNNIKATNPTVLNFRVSKVKSPTCSLTPKIA